MTTLFNFTNALGPVADLSLGTDGDFYGGTQDGGVYRRGSIFRLSVPMPPVFQEIRQSGGLITLRWKEVAGQSYQLQFAPELRAADWANSGNTVLATNGSVTVSRPIDPGANRFYRVWLVA